jgi:hypothetical protein
MDTTIGLSSLVFALSGLALALSSLAFALHRNGQDRKRRYALSKDIRSANFLIDDREVILKLHLAGRCRCGRGQGAARGGLLQLHICGGSRQWRGLGGRGGAFGDSRERFAHIGVVQRFYRLFRFFKSSKHFQSPLALPLTLALSLSPARTKRMIVRLLNNLACICK